MFTGIVEEVGEIVEVTSSRLRIRGPVVTADARPGDSIAVNGVCLTVVHPGVDVATASFGVDVMGETLHRSSLADAEAGTRVNLERALAAGDRMGGHIVQGHVDGTARVAAREETEHWTTVRFWVPRDEAGASLTRYVVEKGSIAVDGVSLTVTAVDDTGFSVGLIPTTLRETTLGDRTVGSTVNLEVDVVAKYVERLAAAHQPAGGRSSQ